MSLWRRLAFTIILAALAAAIGVWGGSHLLAHAGRGPTLHQMVHERLRLSSDQRRRIEVLERDHALRRAILRAQMRAADADLARAYLEDHAYTSRVDAAIDRVHEVMGASQKETLSHIIAMRQVLRPDQTGRFDAMIVGALTSGPS